jgi:peptidoglycan hydrolase CwlO-like protein
MSETFKKYFVIIILGILMCLISTTGVQADEVCFSEAEAVDIITLLDASERDIQLLSSCEALVKELYSEIERRDEVITSLTNDLIKANQKHIVYKEKYIRARNIAWISSLTGILVVLITLL